MHKDLLSKAFKVASIVLSLKDLFLLNTIIYSTFIKAICASGDYNMAFYIIQKMDQMKNLKPTVQIYGIIVKILCKDGCIDQELNLLEIMINKKITPDILLCNSILLALCKHNCINDARKFVKRRMSLFGLPVNVYTNTIFINGSLLMDCVQQEKKGS